MLAAGGGDGDDSASEASDRTLEASSNDGPASGADRGFSPELQVATDPRFGAWSPQGPRSTAWVQAGFSEGSVVVQSGCSERSVRVQSGFSQGSIRVQSGFSDGSVKIPSRFNQVSVRAQWGFCQDSVMVQ